MVQVYSCPTNQTGVEEASKRLGCNVDKYGKDQYICLPNIEKTSLNEICYNGVMGIQEKGNCLVLDNSHERGHIIAESCANFSSGCPENHFWSHELFKYPACLIINSEHRCFTHHLSCAPRNNEFGANTIMDEINEGGNKSIHILLSTFIVFITIFVILILFFIWKKKTRRKETPSQTLPVDEDLRTDCDTSSDENSTSDNCDM
ncbi:uncharacterized protein LOC144625493 isoform X2 [Crassostrea virginica]